MSSLLGAVPTDFTSALVQYGPIGIICAWLMLREWKQQERSYAQEERRDKRHDEMQKEIRLQRQALDDLTRMMGNEVMSRPQVAQRIMQDTQAITEAIKARSAV